MAFCAQKDVVFVVRTEKTLGDNGASVWGSHQRRDSRKKCTQEKGGRFHNWWDITIGDTDSSYRYYTASLQMFMENVTLNFDYPVYHTAFAPDLPPRFVM
jgi:hypothetical protein